MPKGARGGKNATPKGTYIKLVDEGKSTERYEIWINGKKTLYAPNNWRTKKGAENWAKRNNFEITKK